MVARDIFITILKFCTLGSSLAACGAIMNYLCYQCSDGLSYFQFGNSIIFGHSLLMFYVILAFFTKEEIPQKTQLTIHFFSCVMFYLASLMFFWLFFKYYDEFRMIVVIAAVLTSGTLHLLLGILFATPVRLKGVEE